MEAARVIFSAVAKLDGVTSALGNIIKNVSQAISHFILESKFVYHTLSVLKLLPIMGIPLAIYDIALHLIKCIKGTMDEKIEAFLLMAADFGIIGECTATFAHGLQRVGAITKHAISWTTPIFAVSLVFSVATLISYMKGWGESIWMLRQLSKKVQGAEEKTIEDFRPLFEYLQKKNNRFLKKQFRLDPIHLRGKLHTAWENAQQVFQVAEATKLEKELALLKLSKIVKSIKQQTIARVAIQSLMISSCLFGVVSGFLFLFTPAAPVAYGLMASGMALSLTSVAVGAYSNFRFRKNLEIQ
ncbi:hypothetical protein [Parachlamydia sp. AcF125]|uniref:hypothetical protein n=1 Tax=Parachlamydia sp. AcF125 TaxID=2795736 RepID=UPI001BCA1629|nr:hypothetical protein [Parachlamydia sp. AcF125]